MRNFLKKLRISAVFIEEMVEICFIMAIAGIFTLLFYSIFKEKL